MLHALRLFIALVLAVSPVLAHAGPCGEYKDLENLAYRGSLTPDQLTCLEDSLATAEPVERAQSSFLLIVAAYTTGDLDLYEARMRRHLAQYHTTDPEVAYLYARYLADRAVPNWEEVIRWAQVAMDGRRGWLHNRVNYDNMVKKLYDMLVEASLEAAVRYETLYAQDQSEQNRANMEAARRRARHYLIIAAPCLHNNDCGPYYDVEVEGYAECSDLDKLESYAQTGNVAVEVQQCLRTSYRRPTTQQKPRILEILLDNAAAGQERDTWERLLAWHWNVTGKDDPYMALRYTQWLTENGGEPEVVIRWADVGLALQNVAKGREKKMMEQLHNLRIDAAEKAVAGAQQAVKDAPSLETRQAVETATGVLQSAKTARDNYCAEKGCK